MSKSGFGSARQLPSGRWQARLTDAAGNTQNAPVTFATKKQATDWLAEQQVDRLRGIVRDHRGGKQAFGLYATDWIANGGSRGRLAPRTRETYEDILRRDLSGLYGTPLNALQAADVRRWYAQTRKAVQKRAKARGGSGDARLRQSYALLKAILSQAVKDGAIPSNPCTIVGAGIASAPERPYMSPDVLAQIVATMPKHYRVPMHVMFGAHLRLGELVALERGDFDADAGTLRIERQHVTVRRQPTDADAGEGSPTTRRAKTETITTPTKTGQARTVVLPPSTRALLADHIAATKGFPRSPMFTRKAIFIEGRERSSLSGQTASSLTTGGLQQAWRKATKALGIPHFHVHDVRHASLTVAAQAGATTRELMARAGHRTTAAAMTYQHVAEERSAALAERMDALSSGTLTPPSGTYLARGAEQGEQGALEQG